MVDSKHIALGAVSGALAASLVLIVAQAATPSTAKPSLHTLARVQLDASVGAAADVQSGQTSLRPKDQASLLQVAQASSAPRSTDAAPGLSAGAVASPGTRECLRMAGTRIDWSIGSVAEKHRREWREACEKAYVVDGDNPRVQVALASAYGSSGDKEQVALDLYRSAARRNDAQAWFEIYERFKSFDRGRTDRPQLVKRAEAEQGLRQAAELGHPYATMMLANLLDRGATVKRDAEEAIHWAELAQMRPVEGQDGGAMQVLLGRLLVKSAKPEQRARGMKLLEALAAQRGDAKAELAKAIRKDDPVRARRLLEEALRSYPGHAIPPLAEMLIHGEGGTKNEPRAVSLVSGNAAQDVPAVRAAHGRLLAEGRLIKRDLARGADLISIGAAWDHDTRLELMALLAAHPDVKIAHPDTVTVAANEAAELGEPGALTALVELKLSGHVQFGDKTGGCELATKSSDKDVIAKFAARCG